MSSIPETNQINTFLLDEYEAAGWRLVPLKPEDKRPKGTDWPRRTITRAEIEKNLERGGGVGVQAGECSGWLCAADLDTEEARELALRFLPTTLTSGKENERRPSHYVYISEGAGYRRYNDTEGKELIALKASNNGAGHQFVVEPSVHERKGPYRWIGGFDPKRITRISSEDLERRLGRLAAASLIAKHLPTGGRHHYAMQLAGFLLRNGETPDGALELMRPAWELADATPGAFQDLEIIVRGTQDKLENDEPVQGGGKLHEAIPHLPARIGKALGWDRVNNGDGRREYRHTDDGNALRFVDRYGELIRYCPPWKSWLVWDGQRWSKEADGQILRLARATARSIHADATKEPDKEAQRAITKWALQSQNMNRIQAMIGLAKSDERVEIQPQAFDAKPWLLTVENGTIDLKTGDLQPHDPDDLITRLAPIRYDPDAKAPRFLQFAEEIMGGDMEMVGFLKRFGGSTLTGDTRERLMTILHGFGKNGKSTLVETMHAVMGDYAQNTDVETLLVKRYSGVGNDVAALKGARFVSAAEVEKGRQLAESKVKQLTGRDTITARFLFGEYFDFVPEFKLWLSTNNKPVIRGTDDAIWDRIALVPFNQRFDGDKADPNLPDKLREELPGILAWLVEGCLEWQQSGLQKPGAVAQATKQYREEMDTLAAFFEDCCVLNENAYVGATKLYQRYRIWCDTSGEKAETQKAFGMRLSERGFESFQMTSKAEKGLRGWRGISLRVDDSPPDGGDSDPPDGPNEPKSPDNHLPVDDGVDDRLPDKNPPFAGNSSPAVETVDDGRPFFHKVSTTQPRVREESVKRSTSSTSSTDDQQRRIRELVQQGTSERWAEAAVRAPLGPLAPAKKSEELIEWDGYTLEVVQRDGPISLPDLQRTLRSEPPDGKLPLFSTIESSVARLVAHGAIVWTGEGYVAESLENEEIMK